MSSKKGFVIAKIYVYNFINLAKKDFFTNKFITKFIYAII